MSADGYYGFLIHVIHTFEQSREALRQAQGRFRVVAWARQQGLEYELSMHAIQVVAGDESCEHVAHVMWMAPAAAIITRMMWPEMKFFERGSKYVDDLTLEIQSLAA